MPQPERPQGGSLEPVEERRFEGETVVLDGKAFTTCVFTRCVLQFSGAAPTTLVGCTFVEWRWTAVGPAQNVISLLQGMYRDPGMRPLVEATFHDLGDVTTPPPGTSREPSGGFDA